MHAGAGQQTTAADTGVVEGSRKAFSTSSRRRPGQGRCLRTLDFAQVGREPAGGNRPSQNPPAGRICYQQTDQEVDILQTRREGNPGNQTGDGPASLIGYDEKSERP